MGRKGLLGEAFSLAASTITLDSQYFTNKSLPLNTLRTKIAAGAAEVFINQYLSDPNMEKMRSIDLARGRDLDRSGREDGISGCRSR
jgi:hypothetical protein